jgi:hypothetical protein
MVLIHLVLFTMVMFGWSREWEAATLSAAGVAKVEACTTRESTTTSGESAGAPVAPAAKPSLLPHHAEEDLGVDASHATSATSKHVRGVYQVVSIVVTSLLPA